MVDNIGKPKKDKLWILVVEFGIVSDVKLTHLQNAFAETVTTVLGITYELLKDEGGYTINVVFALLNNTPFSDE